MIQEGKKPRLFDSLPDWVKKGKHQPRVIATSPDAAMTAAPQKNGGIDFNPSNLDVELQKNGSGVIMPRFKGPIPAFDADHFIPTIIKISPTVNLPQLLGLEKSDEKRQSLSYNAS